VCGTALIRTEGEAAFYCPNINGCAPQIRGRIEHFIQRKAMDIDSLGEQTIKQLYELDLVKVLRIYIYLKEKTHFVLKDLKISLPRIY
jgi:DNA ligase (NAD+)